MKSLTPRGFASRRAVARGMKVLRMLSLCVLLDVAGLNLAESARADEAPSIGAGADAHAASPAERYAEGVAAYERGEFNVASGVFRALVAEGHAEPTILLAMGNAAYRQEQWVEAVYALEWAKSLAPTDKDVAANLEQARVHLVRDELPNGGSEAALKFREFLRGTPTLWSAIAFALSWSVGWGVLALRQRGRARNLGPLAAAAILLAIPFAAHVAFRVQDTDASERGIVQALEQDVRSGPGDRYATLFTLHAGTVVAIGEDRAGWRRITLEQGSQGWIPASALAIFGRVESLATR